LRITPSPCSPLEASLMREEVAEMLGRSAAQAISNQKVREVLRLARLRKTLDESPSERYR
jgi:hypothetical protein